MSDERHKSTQRSAKSKEPKGDWQVVQRFSEPGSTASLSLMQKAAAPAVDERPFALELAQRPRATYWSYSRRTKIVRLLDRLGWRRVDDQKQAKLVWGRTPEKIDWSSLRSGQLVDWVRGTEFITDKGLLYRVLSEAGVADQLQPETFVISDPQDYERFKIRAKAEPAAIWIKKPTNRGSGIGVEVVPDAQAFCARWDGESRESSDPCLIQRYVEDPLLLDGTKSEIRSYCLVASADPLMALFYDGTIRLTLSPYEKGNWTDPLRHINNTYRQKRADPASYKKLSARLKWTYGRLESDLNARGLTQEFGFLDRQLRPRLKAMYRDVLRAVQPHLERRPGAFQLLGMDCILTDDLQKVWLTEMQRGPGLSVNDPVKSRLVPQLLEEALEIVFEVEDRRQRGADLRQLDSLRHFQWILNDAAPSSA